MGTNYYACWQDEGSVAWEELHLGKNSYGWSFLFHGYRQYKVNDKLTVNLDSCIKWKAFLKNPSISIEDEYGKLITVENFFKMVEDCQKNSHMTHYSWLTTNKLLSEHDWMDSEGYSFCDNEFS